MNKGKNFLFGIVKILIISFLIISCSEDDDSGSIVDQNIIESSFVTNENPESFIENDGKGKVTVKVVGKLSDGTFSVESRGYVYGTTSDLKVVSQSLTVETDTDAKADIKGLDQNTTYYIRGFIKRADNSYFYGNEIKIKTPKWTGERAITMRFEKPTVKSRNVVLPIKIENIIGDPPIEIGIEYSLKEDFSESQMVVSTAKDIVADVYDMNVIFLKPITKYYFRPYAKYDDKKIDINENVKAEVTTEDFFVGDDYPITKEEFLDMKTSRFVVFSMSNNARTIKIIQKTDMLMDEGWTNEDTIDGLSVRNPKEEELRLIKTRTDVLTTDILDINVIWVLYDNNADKLNNINYWIDKEDGASKAFGYNPFSDTKVSIDKENKTLKTRYVSEITY